MDMHVEEMIAQVNSNKKASTPLCERCHVNSQQLLFGRPLVIIGHGALCEECLKQVLDKPGPEVVS